MSNKKLKSSINKKPAIFALIGIVLSTFFIFWFAFSNDALSIRLIIIVFCSIFDIFGIILFCGQALVWVEIKDDYFHSWILFVHRKLPLSKIKEIVCYDNAYTFYLKGGKKFAAINSNDPMAGQIIMSLEKNGAKYIEK